MPLPWMMRLILALFLAGLTQVRAANEASAAPQSWNIVAIMSDDHSRSTVGAYGDRQAVTPNLDRLAQAGALFTRAYAAAPVCSPSRAAFFTGQFPSQVGVHDFFLNNPYYSRRGLEPQALTWPQVLQRHGYATALIGKWHLGEGEQFDPHRRGFDYFVGYDYGVPPYDPVLNVDGEEKKVTGHTSDIFTGEAVGFLERNRKRPFALVITYREPQQPWDKVPAEDLAAVADIHPVVPAGKGMDPQWLTQQLRNKYAAIHTLDRSIGRVMETLRRLKLDSKTIVLYAGDHGMLIGHHGLFGRGAVGVVVADSVVNAEGFATLVDDAIGIPFMIRWPGVVKPGTRIDTLTSNTDVFSTVLGMLGIEVPREAKPQGVDLSPVLRGTGTVDRDAVFAQYDMENYGRNYLRMVRTDQWKLIRRFGLAADSAFLDSLYDMQADPGETRNLIRSPQLQTVKADLERRLQQWQKRIQDPVLALDSCRSQVAEGERSLYAPACP